MKNATRDRMKIKRKDKVDKPKEPEIISYGRGLIGDYAAEEFKASLVRAFRDGQADFIALDDNINGQGFLAACAAWAIDQKLLYNDKNESDGQCKVSSFRLTKAGEEAILLAGGQTSGDKINTCTHKDIKGCHFTIPSAYLDGDN